VQTDADNFPGKFEDSKAQYWKTLRSKEEVREIIKKEGLKDYELFIISHGYLLRDWTAKSWGPDLKPVDYVHFDNTHIHVYDLTL